jgi:diacylglycerol kinase (ATP)
VAGGLIDAGGTARLGILPIGTGNDFARGLGLVAAPGAAADAWLAGGTRRIDAIRCSRAGQQAATWAVNAAVAGLGGRISDGMSQPMRRRWRGLAYLRAGLGELATARPEPITLQVDDRRFELDALMVVVAGGRFAGGGLPFAPSADPSDGRLDVVVLLDTPRIMLAPTLWKLLRSTHGDADNVLSVAGTRVVLETSPSVWVNLDGETWGTGPAAFEVVPGALEVVVP